MSNGKISRITLWSCILGHGLELYDFTLYGAFTTFIALNFFPNIKLESSFFQSLMALAVGYIARPIGAIVFGCIGDIYGRKRSLILTITIASISTGIIGLCPSYTSIGVSATIILFLARFMQGLCAGAETSDASIFLIEHGTSEQSSYGSAMIFLSGALGSLIALFISRIFIGFNIEWAWRLPFIVGFSAGIFVLYLRFKVDESLEYKKKKTQDKKLNPSFFYEILKNYRPGLIKSLSCGALSGITSTTIVVFTTLFLYKVLNIDIESALSFSFYGLSSFIFACFICSKIPSQRIRDKVMTFSVFGLILFSGIYFYLIGTGLPIPIILAQLILGVLAGSFISPVNSFLSDQFPVDVRCTGVSVGYNTGYAITSGLYPMLAFKIINVTGIIYSPFIFMFIFSLLLFLVMTLKKISNNFIPQHDN